MIFHIFTCKTKSPTGNSTLPGGMSTAVSVVTMGLALVVVPLAITKIILKLINHKYIWTPWKINPACISKFSVGQRN